MGKKTELTNKFYVFKVKDIMTMMYFISDCIL